MVKGGVKDTLRSSLEKGEGPWGRQGVGKRGAEKRGGDPAVGRRGVWGAGATGSRSRRWLGPGVRPPAVRGQALSALSCPQARGGPWGNGREGHEECCAGFWKARQISSDILFPLFLKCNF